MKIKRALALACVCTALPFVGAACGDSYDRAEFIDDLVTEGITQEQAVCITDRVEEEIGVDRLNSRGSLSDEENAKLVDATFECVLGSE